MAGHAPQSLDVFAYSIAFPVAAMIVRRQVGVSELSQELLGDPDILRVSRAINLIGDAEMTQISIDKRWAQVSFELKDGSKIESTPRTPRGDADMPLIDKEISFKFHSLANPILGTSRADEIEALSGQFDTLSIKTFTICWICARITPARLARRER